MGNTALLNKYDELEKTKLNAPFERIIKFIENKYYCSGFCSPPLFYYSQPLTKGVPKDGCLLPLNQNTGEEMLYLGIVFQATAIIFLAMLVCTCPLFCFDNELAIKEAAAEKDIELARR